LKTDMASIGIFASCTLPSVVTRADDVPGAWVAECVPLGVITQGDSLRHAIEMLVEAVDMVVDDDLSRGVDPLKTRVPLPGSVEELATLMSHPLQPVDIAHADDKVSTVLVLVRVVRPHVPAMGSSEAEELEKRYTPVGSPLTVAA
jgi:predicted RNase H-like HicB family nuclease